MNPIVVQKYGGSSLATPDKIRAVAERIAQTVASGHRVVAVVSAMGGHTDALLSQAKGLSANPNARELDMLMSVGERVSTALLSIALYELGLTAISFTGSQAGIITNARHNRARIVEVRPYRVLDELDSGKVVVVAGYQGVSYGREITTLGRGGTDTTAVALAAALEAAWCEICSDVDGVYTADPRIAPDAKRLDSMDYDAMIALARSGGKVLNQDCVEYASRLGVAVFAKATFGPRDDKGTVVRLNPSYEPPPVTAIAHRAAVLGMTLAAGRDVGQLVDVMAGLGAYPAELFGGGGGAWQLRVPLTDTHRLEALLARLAEVFGDDLTVERELGTVTVVGHGLGEEPSVLRRATDAAVEVLGRAPAARLGPLTLTFDVPEADVKRLVAALHQSLL